MVSTDVVVEASAMLIAAILFLVTVRQALELPAFAYAKQAAGAVFVFISAIAAALGEDLFPAEWQVGFGLGLRHHVWVQGDILIIESPLACRCSFVTK